MRRLNQRIKLARRLEPRPECAGAAGKRGRRRVRVRPAGEGVKRIEERDREDYKERIAEAITPAWETTEG